MRPRASNATVRGHGVPPPVQPRAREKTDLQVCSNPGGPKEKEPQVRLFRCQHRPTRLRREVSLRGEGEVVEGEVVAAAGDVFAELEEADRGGAERLCF